MNQRLKRVQQQRPVNSAELLVRQIAQPRHKRVAQQKAETEQLLGEPMRVGVCFHVSPRGGQPLGQPFTYDLFDSLELSEFGASSALVRRIVWATSP